LRKEHNLTQEQLGKKINVTKVSISGYENGNRTPDSDTLNKIADFFDVTTDYLYGRSDTPNNSGSNNPLPELTEKDEKDIAKRIDKMREDLQNVDGGLSFSGEPMSKEAAESLLEALEYAEKQATRINKKYIPKKYRDK